jgi:hypothetical protein
LADGREGRVRGEELTGNGSGESKGHFTQPSTARATGQELKLSERKRVFKLPVASRRTLKGINFGQPAEGQAK